MRRTVFLGLALLLALAANPALTQDSETHSQPQATTGDATASLPIEPVDLIFCSGFGARGQANPSSTYGSVAVIDLNGICSGPRYTAGTPLQFTATAAAGHSFLNWSNGTGCTCTGTNPVCNMTMPSALVVCIANFS